MNGLIPFRIPLSCSFVKFLLVSVISIAFAAAIAASPLPLWLRAWLWIPAVVGPLALMFVRMQGRTLLEAMIAAWAFVRRRRIYVWRVRRGREEARSVPVFFAGPTRRRLFIESAGAVGLAAGVVVTVLALGLVGAAAGSTRWPAKHSPTAAAVDASVQDQATPRASVAVIAFTPSRQNREAAPGGKVVAASEPISNGVFVSPSAVRFTPTPSQDGVEVYEQQVMVFPGILSMRSLSFDSVSCSVEIFAPGARWTASFRMPGDRPARMLAAPLLQPQIVGRALVVRSACRLEVESKPLQFEQIVRSRLWLVPVCDPPGRLRVILRGNGDATGGMTLLDADGKPVAAVAIPPAGAWVPRQPAKGCWLYRIEAPESVWLETLVIKE